MDLESGGGDLSLESSSGELRLKCNDVSGEDRVVERQRYDMDAKPSRKRPLSDDDDAGAGGGGGGGGGGDGDGDEFNRKPTAKRVRFPKGKKVKPEDEVVAASVPQVAEDEPKELQDTQLVAKARLKRRHKDKAELINEENADLLDVVAASEMQYEDNEALVDDGIQLEPFNLEQERKEGFFDKTGNYVEYVTNDIKDAWLDSIDANPNLAQRHSVVTNDIVEAADLSSEDIGSIKRRIADVLEPGETVLQALRRLKGSSNSRKEKMSAETKVVFDQLTEDAMKLMEDGDYNVYHENQEVFQREAEGFEKLARARGVGTSSSSGNNQPTSSGTADLHLNGMQGADGTSNNEDDFDMFAEDDDGKATVDPLAARQFYFCVAGAGPTQNDYVFDESSGRLCTNAHTTGSSSNLVGDDFEPLQQPKPSKMPPHMWSNSLEGFVGYYYSSSLGYYYDPSSTLYCNAASGQW
ncbi:hypothetical protein OSB04_031074 [Centaurea solstitialis]|uniref:OCRE domain-containing protein n=1 Tax=Centaurea solstitialis TaxID=347529 RepID=A0AA38W7R9_9ASTR|nr:hypothetical protein OSB04_031074 [Centaurea solstitialis]